MQRANNNSRFPHEILLKVFEYASTGEPSIKDFMIVCKSWETAGVEAFYKQPIIITSGAAKNISQNYSQYNFKYVSSIPAIKTDKKNDGEDDKLDIKSFETLMLEMVKLKRADLTSTTKVNYYLKRLYTLLKLYPDKLQQLNRLDISMSDGDIHSRQSCYNICWYLKNRLTNIRL